MDILTTCLLIQLYQSKSIQSFVPRCKKAPTNMCSDFNIFILFVYPFARQQNLTLLHELFVFSKEIFGDSNKFDNISWER